MSESQGGRGEFWDGDFRNSDARLVNRAMREGWPIPQALRRDVVMRVGRIVRSNEAAPRDITAAGRLLLSAGRSNLEGVRTSIQAQVHEDLCRRVKRIEQHDKMEDQRRAAGRGSVA
jgi:hypothetical protein